MFRKVSTSALTLCFALLGFGIPLLWTFLKPKLPGIAPIVDPWVIFFFFFSAGCTGLLWLIRKEAPQVITLRGGSAQVLGATLLIAGWGLAIYTLWWSYRQ